MGKMGNLIIERKVNLKYLLIRISNSELWTVEWKYVHIIWLETTFIGHSVLHEIFSNTSVTNFNKYWKIVTNVSDLIQRMD